MVRTKDEYLACNIKVMVCKCYCCKEVSKHFGSRGVHVTTTIDQYCDKMWLPKPNLDAGLFGINIAQRDYIPSGIPTNHATKGRIFASTYREDTMNMALYDYITYTDDISCDIDFITESWSTLQSYIKGTSDFSQSEINLGFSDQGAISKYFKFADKLGSNPMNPPAFSASVGSGSSESNSNLEYFFNHEHGSIARSSAKCQIYPMWVDVKGADVTLYSNFIQAIRAIDKAYQIYESENCTDNSVLEAEVKSFIQEYGTHYAASSKMYIGVEFEHRYTESETKEFTKTRRKECSSSVGGFDILGLIKYDESSKACTKDFSKDTFEEGSVIERFKSRSFGTIPKGKSLNEWAAGAMEQLNDNTLGPLPLTQTLEPIYELLDTKAVKDITREDTNETIDAENVLKQVVLG